MPLEVRLASTLAVMLAGCSALPSSSDGGSDGGSDASVTRADAGMGDAGTLVGTFQLLHLVGDGQSTATTSLFGKVYDGPTPQTLIWEVDTADGDCRLETPRVPFCATPCGGSAVCVENDVCQPYALSRSVGNVTATGVLTEVPSSSFEMTPIVNGYQPPAGINLAVPPFADGAALKLEASGSTAVAAFTLQSTGVAALSLGNTSLALSSGTPLSLTWPGGSSTTAARIKVKLDISHHGGTRGQILCDTADDGNLVISGALIQRLISLGVSGFPTIVVRREKVGSTVIAAGRVDFVVASTLEQPVEIPGLVSCTEDLNCPSGQTCQNDLRCQ